MCPESVQGTTFSSSTLIERIQAFDIITAGWTIWSIGIFKEWVETLDGIERLRAGLRTRYCRTDTCLIIRFASNVLSWRRLEKVLSRRRESNSYEDVLTVHLMHLFDINYSIINLFTEFGARPYFRTLSSHLPFDRLSTRSSAFSAVSKRPTNFYTDWMA